MPTSSLEEGSLRFDFDSDWDVCKWDDSNAYRDGIRRLQGSKAVDIIALRSSAEGRQWFFIEVKDFRKEPTKNKHRIETDLAQEVAEKVRDTVSGVAGAHVSRHHEIWFRWLEFVPERTQARVVLWAEEIPSFPGHGSRQVWEQRAKAHRTTLVNEIKKRVSWLTKRVGVYSTADTVSLPGLVVHNLPGAGAPP